MKEALCIFCARKQGIEPEYEPLTSSIPTRDYTCPECGLDFIHLKGEVVETESFKNILEKIKLAREITRKNEDYPGKERRYKIFAA